MSTIIRLFCGLFCLMLIQACAYHNRIPRDIFAGPLAEDRIAASVLVASDKIAQKQFVLKDYHSSNSVHSYKIDLADGSLVATADALATLFEQVEVNPSKYATNYNYRAELNYTVSNGKTDSLESIQWFGGQPPLLETRVAISIYDVPTGKLVFSMFASRQNRVEMSDAAAVTQRVENKGKTLFLPVTGPVYSQQFGSDLRYTLTRDLSQCLEEIAQTLEQNRMLFSGGNSQTAQNNVE